MILEHSLIIKMANETRGARHGDRKSATLLSGCQTWHKRACALLLLAAAAALGAPAQVFTVLYTFTGGADGGYPQYGRLIVDHVGNLYGTATFGGDLNCPLLTYPGPGCGVVFKLNPSTKKETVLYTFSGGTDGGQPWSGLVRDPNGNLYGTAAFGGSNGAGVIFKVDPSGEETILHTFSHVDGANPTGDLLADSYGNLYGTTVTGGDLNACSGMGCGVIFKKSPFGKLELLHAFHGSVQGDGANPTHGVIRDTAGNIYGTAENGGLPFCFSDEGSEALETFVEGCGEVFILDPTGTEMPLHKFKVAPDGSDPRSALIQDSAGNLYGTTFYGGLYGGGTVFKVNQTATETVLYSFQGTTDGANPWGGLVQDAAGNLYGTTNHAGGPCYCGTVFKLDTEGNYKVLHTFAGTDGQYPEAPLLLHRGVLYGITSGGGTLSDGSAGAGTIFEITPTQKPTISANPASLSFAYSLLRGANPASQTTIITASGGEVIPFTAAASTTSGGNWLSVVSNGSNTPAALTVSVNPTGLTAGVYDGTITLTAPRASNNGQTIPVTFTVTAPPTLSTTASSLTFEYQIGGSSPSSQSFAVSSSGAALSYAASAATTFGGTWLSVAPGSATTPAIETASVNISALAAGTYNGSITIASSAASNSPVIIPVTLTVSTESLLTVSPPALTFNYTIGGSAPVAQIVNVGSTGASLIFSATASTSWITVTQAGTTTPGSFSVSVNTSAQPAGTHNGIVTITAAGASNSPLSYPVTLIVTGQPSLVVGPPALAFGGQAGAANPASQTISVASTAGGLSFTAAASGGNWLSVAPTSGTTNATLTVSVNTAGLAAGTYSGSIVIAASLAANPSVTVPVILTLVSNALTVAPTSMSFSYQLASVALPPRPATVGRPVRP